METCNCCRATIQTSERYVFYSAKPARLFMIKEESAGRVLLCSNCAETLCTQKNFAKKLPARFGYSVEGVKDLLEMGKELDKKSIVDICRAHDLTPEKALQKAHEVGAISFSDHADATAKAREVWLEPLGEPKRHISLGSGVQWTLPSWGPDDSISKCFIASACYESYSHPDVLLLQSFRDQHLIHWSLGRVFVSLYYKVSPPIAGWLKEHRLVRTTVRTAMIRPVILFLHLVKKLAQKKD